MKLARLGSLSVLSLIWSTASCLQMPASVKSYDLICIGGGSTGITAAKFARTFGKSVAIIEKARMGGDCTWTGCVPSKTLLSAAHAAAAARNAGEWGVTTGPVTVDWNKV